MIEISAKIITIDLAQIKTVDDLHAALKKKFQFPDFYGANINALIDCLFSLRFPENQLIGFSINENESLILELLSLDYSNYAVINELLRAVESVNDRYLSIGKIPAILLLISTVQSFHI